MMHPLLRKAAEGLLIVSGGIFLVLSVLTVVGIVLIIVNGGHV